MGSDDLVRPRSALLIIDVQIGLVKIMPAEVQATVLLNIGALIAKARSSGVAVIHIQHDGPKGHPLELHTEGWNIHDSIKPAEGEPVINKRESDSFFETTLQQELKRRGITHLIISGGMTEYCWTQPAAVRRVWVTM